MIPTEGSFNVDIGGLFEQGKPIDDAIARAAYEAIARHKALNQSIVVWQDGAPRTLRPEEIDLDSFRPESKSTD